MSPTYRHEVICHSGLLTAAVASSDHLHLPIKVCQRVIASDKQIATSDSSGIHKFSSDRTLSRPLVRGFNLYSASAPP
nr:hypothetical protein CFP56_03706 [Quercus suber]